MQHPEQPRDAGLEPTVGEQLRLAEALQLIERAGTDDLRQIARLLAQQALMVQPAAIRYLSREAARNLGGGWRGGEAGAELLELLLAGATGEEPEATAP